MGGPDELRVHLLGGLEVEGVPVLALGSRKGRAVLRRLAVASGGVVPADALVDTAWPEGAPVRAQDQLSVLVSRLRSALGSERVVRRDAGYALSADWLDVGEVDLARIEVGVALATGEPAAALARGRAALQVVRGELLPEEQADAPWLVEARTACRRAVARLQVLTAEAALAAGAARDCVDLAQRCLDEDPYDEQVLRLLMRASLATGQVSSALATYQAVSARLADELGVDPSPETRAVHLELLRRTTEPAPPPATPVNVAGREALVAELLARLEQVQDRRPALALVTGSAGMGKTTLLDQLAAKAAPLAEVLRVHGDPLSQDLPLQPVLDALALAVAGRPELLSAGAGLLAPLLDGSPAATHSAAVPTLTSGSDRAALASAVGAVLERLGDGRPVLLLVDDGQLLDPPSAQLLQHLTRPAARLPLLVVVAARPGEGPPWHAGATHELRPLTRDDAARLVGEEQADALWERSGGHPLFLVELARWEGALPESVLAAVATRCTRSEDLGGVLRTAAALGGTVDVDLLAGVLELPVGTLLDHLDRAVEQGLLKPTSTGYAFSHDLYREALASLVTPARAAVVHRQAAQLLARRTGVDPGRLGHHALAGGDDALAAAALTAAAEVAGARYEHDQALSLLDRAVALAPTPARRLQRARALLLTGRYDEAQHEAESVEGDGTRAAAREVQALAAYCRRDIRSALALAAAAAGETSDPELAAGCLTLSARILFGSGELDEAESALREAMALSTGQVRGVAAVWLSLTLSGRGDASQAHEVITSPVTRQVRALPLVEPHRAMALGRALAMLGRSAEALEAFERLAVTVEEQHVRRFAGRAENFRGWVLRNLGALEEAEESNLAAWEAVQRLDDVAGAEARGHAVLDLADSALRLGDLAGTHEWLGRATEDLAPHVMKWRYDLRRELTVARLALEQHELDDAEEHAAAVRDRAASFGVARFVAQADVVLARARHRAGGPVDREALPGLAAVLGEVAPLESWWLLADLARDLDDPALARLAAHRLELLLPGAGPWADRLRSAGRQVLADLPL